MKTISADKDFAAEWERIAQEASLVKKELAPNEITRNEFCTKSGLSIEEADRYINRLIKEGKAEFDYRTVGGHRQKIYQLLT